MTLQLYAHPFSSYCQKVLIALYENATPFELRMLGPGDDPEKIADEFAARWPLRKMPMLVDAGRTVVEATIIVEHLDLFHRGRVRFLPDDARAALDVRTLDRFFDNYLMTPMQKIVGDALRKPGQKDPQGVADAHTLLDTAYRWLDGQLAAKEKDGDWAAGAAFSLADCAAAPALLYADWVHPIAPEHERVRAYRQRLLARPSYARCVEDARPYRALFPLGDPGRD
jgi:glutathione S-transferase